MKSIYKVPVLLLSASLLFSCSKDSENSPSKTEQAMTMDVMNEAIGKMVSYDKADSYSDWKKDDYVDIKLQGNKAVFEETNSIFASENTITIKTSGVYVFSGQWNDGQIMIDAEDKAAVRIVLNGADITCSDHAPIFIKNAEKTVISLPEGTVNKITDGSKYALEKYADNEPNAAIFSKDDLTINGKGSLIVNGNYNNGIASKDDLKITGGRFEIYAVDDGLMGRDVAAVKDGTFMIEAGGDGIKSTNEEKEDKGGIVLEGGSFQITAGGDGMQAASSLYITDGKYSVKSGGGSPETVVVEDERRAMFQRRFGTADENSGQADMKTEAADMQKEKEAEAGEKADSASDGKETDDTPSTKGMKAAKQLAISGGTFHIDAADDAVHSNEGIEIIGGDLELATGDDAIHADSSIVISSGKIEITKSNEGIESRKITIFDGDITIHASDDGINIGGGNDGSGFEMGLGRGRGMMPRGGFPPEFDGVMPEMEMPSGEPPADFAPSKMPSGEPPADFAPNNMPSGGPPADFEPNNRLGDAKKGQGISAENSGTDQVKDGEKNSTGAETKEGKNKTAADGNLKADTAAEKSNEETMLLAIHGGNIYVNAGGDGLDSNGSITMSDGTVIVNGPEDNMNGPLDYDKSFDMSGGFLIAAGSSGMAQAPSEASSQNSILMSFPKVQSAGTLVLLEDSKGKTIAAFAPKKKYQSIVISSPELQKGESYTLYTGGTASGMDNNGLYKDGSYKNGSKIVEFTISESVTYLNESGITEGRRQWHSVDK